MRVAIAFAIASLFVAGVASAQPVKPLIPIATSDTLMPPDARDVAALQPLRLDLMSGAVPHPYGTPGCEPAGLATGISPLPNQGIAANGIRLLGNLRLTLFGFSRDGCAYDQLSGGGLAVTMPIKKDVMFMWGGGAIYLPHGGPNGEAKQETAVHVDVVWQGNSGRTYMVGVGAKNGSPHVSFGGLF
jgi:hypothetical protein